MNAEFDQSDHKIAQSMHSVKLSSTRNESKNPAQPPNPERVAHEVNSQEYVWGLFHDKTLSSVSPIVKFSKDLYPGCYRFVFLVNRIWCSIPDTNLYRTRSTLILVVPAFFLFSIDCDGFASDLMIVGDVADRLSVSW
jgi:hypothetical protein